MCTKQPLKCGHLSNKDIFSGPKGVRNREVPLYNIGSMDDLYLSMICLEHAHYLVAIQDHVQINKYTLLPVSRVIRGSLRLAPNYLIVL